MNTYQNLESQYINAGLDSLPTAELRPLIAVSPDGLTSDSIEDKAVFCNGNHVGTVSKQYKLVQHKDAFKPIIDGLIATGHSQFEFTTWSTDKKAFLGITLGETIDTVHYGFRATNGYDGNHAIDFGFKADRIKREDVIVEREHVQVWGFRQVCSNGMVVKVPIKSTKYLDIETRTKVQNVIAEYRRITHVGNVEFKLEQIQYLVEAFLLLKNPVEKMIRDAQDYHIDRNKAREWVERYIGSRLADRVMEQFGLEDQTLWGVYNAVTNIASHDSDLRESTKDGLLDKSATMLTEELLEVTN